MARDPQPALDIDAVWAAVDAERSSLADLLEPLSPEQWTTPSLCEGWQVRDVAAHLALAHMPARRAVVELARARGSFDRMVRDTGRRHARSTSTQVLVGELRAMVGSRAKAPGVSHVEPLLDVLVHGQDVAVPLGVVRPMPVDAAATAATRVWTCRWPVSTAFRARPRLRGLRLVATDTEWSAGEGAPVEGPVQALLMLLTGRAAARYQLAGEGARRLVWAPGRLRVAGEERGRGDGVAGSAGHGDHQV